MENKVIQLKLKHNVIIELSSDTPNIQDIIEKIVEHRETLRVDEIEVLCKDVDDFDKEGFETMMKDVIDKYLKTLELEDINYNKVFNV